MVQTNPWQLLATQTLILKRKLLTRDFIEDLCGEGSEMGGLLGIPHRNCGLGKVLADVGQICVLWDG